MTLTICHRLDEQPAKARSYRECPLVKAFGCCRLLFHAKFFLHEDRKWVGFYRMFLGVNMEAAAS